MSNELVLENYGVSELHSDEMRETDGGSILGTLFICFMVGLLFGIAFSQHNQG
jgi:hypothetical protein